MNFIKEQSFTALIFCSFFNILNSQNSIDENLLKKYSEEHDQIFALSKAKPISPEDKSAPLLKRIAQKHIGEIPFPLAEIFCYYEKYGESPVMHNKFLLIGEPGVGKTHLVETIAQQCEIPLLTLTPSFFDDACSKSSRDIRKAFEDARKYNKPVMIFIDNIDLYAPSKGDHSACQAAIYTLLSELKNNDKNYNIFIFAATNRPDLLNSTIRSEFENTIPLDYLNNHEKALLLQKIFTDNEEKIDIKMTEKLIENTSKKTSCREIEHLARQVVFQKYMDCQKNSEICTKTLGSYIEQKMNI